MKLIKDGVLSAVPIDKEKGLSSAGQSETRMESRGIGVAIEPDDQVALGGDGRSLGEFPFARVIGRVAQVEAREVDGLG